MDAIQRQLVSDVPVATFLSGGLDSSLISAVADTYFTARGRQLQTFSVGYKDNRRYFHATKFQPGADAPYIRKMNDFLGRAAPLGHAGHPRTGAGALRRGGGPRPARHGGRGFLVAAVLPPDQAPCHGGAFGRVRRRNFWRLPMVPRPRRAGKVRLPLGAVHGLPGGIYKGGRAGGHRPGSVCGCAVSANAGRDLGAAGAGLRWRPGCARWSI